MSAYQSIIQINQPTIDLIVQEQEKIQSMIRAATPAIKIANEYQEIISQIVNTVQLPTHALSSIKLLEDEIQHFAKIDLFVDAPFDWSEDNIREYIYKEIGENVDFNVESKNKDTSVDYSVNFEQISNVDKQIKNFDDVDTESKMGSIKWHKNLWISTAYILVIEWILTGAFEQLTNVQVDQLFTTLIQIFRNL